MTFFKSLIKKIFNKNTGISYPYTITQFHSYPHGLLSVAKKIKLLIFDVDGVFTDGRLYFDAKGLESKGFHAHDGFGFKHLHRLPIKLAVITGRSGGAVKHRIKKQLKVKYSFFGIKNKYTIYKRLLRKFNLSHDQVAFVGDDIPDVQIMEKVILPIATANATPYIKHIAAWITPKPGAEGAVRNVADLFIAAYQVNKSS
jgi:3-deoxy-D-manno-octulosonate 8-phosphate phosphatase (KDO 8-P phosphatase)